MRSCVAIAVPLLLAATGCTPSVPISQPIDTNEVKRKPTLEAYASQLPTASEPGPHIRDWVAAKAPSSLAPDERLFRLYQDVSTKWKYTPDDAQDDTFRNAEAMVATGSLMGDCEDCCAVLVAGCRVLGLTCHVCLGEADDSGHAWVEVLVDRVSKEESPLAERIRDRFGNNASVVYRQDICWLQLSPCGSLSHYRATHAITTCGQLLFLSE